MRRGGSRREYEEIQLKSGEFEEEENGNLIK